MRGVNNSKFFIELGFDFWQCNSLNLIKAFEYASDVGMHTVAITAFDGGRLKLLSDEGIHVPTEINEYGPAEDAHMILDHLLGAYLMRIVRKAK